MTAHPHPLDPHAALETDVLIAGGGPCGLMLAIELGRRGIRCLVVDAKPSTAFNPQANATQARTMEHFRRLGFADEVRALGLPADHPTDIAYFTRYASHELARISLPTAAEAVVKIKSMTGSWSAAELPHRVSQKFVEQVLRRQAQAQSSNDVRYGWKLTRFHDDGQSVHATIGPTEGGPTQSVAAKYLVGADGARSLVRRELGVEWGGVSGAQREFMGGKMFAVYLRAPGLLSLLRHPKAWMYVAVNHERRSFMASVDGHSEYAFHAALRPGEDADTWTEADARRVFCEAVGAQTPIEILSMGTWLAGHALVAQRLQQGRVFIAGDAAHLFTPTGGLGYNTAVEDAVNLAWKLASVIRGSAPAALLSSYEAERKPLAERNTGFARSFADSIGLFHAKPVLDEDTAQGAAERELASTYLNGHARLEFNIPGVSFGGRYDRSSIIVADGAALPPDDPNAYTATASPGGRPPHAWLEDGRSLYDLFHSEWTLLALGPRAAPTAAFEAQARAMRIDLKVVRLPLPSLLELYESPLALIRPDQIVAWRGSSDDNAADVLATVTGHGMPSEPTMHTVDQHTITEAVQARQANTADPRLKRIMDSLVKHLHDFAREVELTEEEWFKGIQFLTRCGHITDDKRQEFILLSDVLGLSMLTVAQNNDKPAGCTEATVFGPFHVEGAPQYPLGADIANGARGKPCLVRGTVRGIDGRPIADAELDVWQSDEDGLYDVQHTGIDRAQARGVLRADEQGRFHFRSILAMPYSIPHDGPVGDLLEATGRHPWRPAHLHFMIKAPGWETLVTHVFRSDDLYLDSDAVFGVRQSLIADWTQQPDGGYLVEYDFVLNPAA